MKQITFLKQFQNFHCHPNLSKTKVCSQRNLKSTGGGMILTVLMTRFITYPLLSISFSFSFLPTSTTMCTMSTITTMCSLCLSRALLHVQLEILKVQYDNHVYSNQQSYLSPTNKTLTKTINNRTQEY